MHYYKIRDFKVIGSEFALKLENAGVLTTEHLLEKAGDMKSRSKLAGTTAISEMLITKWVALANLMRVEGITMPYGELLFGLGVDSTDKLLTFQPRDLVLKLEELNKIKKMVPDAPKFEDVEKWQAELRTPIFANV